MSHHLQFSVPGTPTAWARARSHGRRRFNSDRHEQGLSAICSGFEQAAPEWTPWEGPVEMLVVCHYLAPKDYWEGKACTRKPDLDNLLKLVGDALSGVAYRDDALIVKATVLKAYTQGQERTEVCLQFHEPVLKPKKTKKEQVKS